MSRPKRKPVTVEDLQSLLARFSDARSVLECATRSLEAGEIGEQDDRKGTGDEEVCLRHGLTLLAAIYNDLDLTFGRLS